MAGPRPDVFAAWRVYVSSNDRTPNARWCQHGVGLERLRQVSMKHGGRSAEARQAARERGRARQVIAALEELLRR
jgi:hypothetical protein